VLQRLLINVRGHNHPANSIQSNPTQSMDRTNPNSTLCRQTWRWIPSFFTPLTCVVYQFSRFSGVTTNTKNAKLEI